MTSRDAIARANEAARRIHAAVTIKDRCSHCASEFKACAECGERIVFVPKSGFGNAGEYRHLEPPKTGKFHLPHPVLHIT